VPSVFIWGLLLSAGLGESGFLEQVTGQLTTEAQHLLHLATYIVVGILAVVSILIFVYPILRGVRA
jgi:Na+/melibiose symporter-like transporter